MQICRSGLGPLRPGNGLALIDRISLVETFLYWSANYTFRLLGIIVPILYWLLNINTVHADVATTLSYYLPTFIAQIAIMGWMAQGRVMPVMSDVTQLLAATQIVRAVAHGLVKPKGHKFHVTAKGGDRSRRVVQWPLLRIFLAYLTLTIAGVIWAFVFEDGSRLRDSSALCLFWSWYNIVVLSIACIVCVEQPRLRAADRLATRDAATVHAGDQIALHRILDISLSGARLAGEAPGHVGASLSITVDGVRVPATVVRRDQGHYAIRFEDSATTRGSLIRLIYSGRFSAAVAHIEPARLASAVLGRMLR